MGPKLPGYWLMTWLGLTGNLLALPVIGLVAFQASSLQAATISVAFALAWPAAIVGIVASAGLLGERHWGVILAIVSLSMQENGWDGNETRPSLTELSMNKYFVMSPRFVARSGRT